MAMRGGRGIFAVGGVAVAFGVYLVAASLATMKMELLYSGDMPSCEADTGCVLDVYATATAVVAVNGSGQAVTVQNSGANGFEAAPMVGGGGSVIYAAKDITDGTAPFISAADAQTVLGTTFWSSDHTVMCAAAPTLLTAVSPFIVSHGVTASDGFSMVHASGTALRCRYHASGSDQNTVNHTYTSSGKWAATSCAKATTSYIARVNGAETTVAVAVTAANPADNNLYFGRFENANFPMRGPLYRCRFWNTALSSATKSLREAQLLKGLATRPADTYVTTVRASATYDWYADGFVHASGDNVSIPHSTKGLASFAGSAQLLANPLAADSWSAIASVIVAANVESGIFSKWTGAAEVDRLSDESAAATGRITQNANVVAGTVYTYSCVLKADSTNTPTMQVGSGTGTCSATCDQTLTASYERYSCNVTPSVSGTCVFALFPARSNSIANTGSILFDGCQVEPTATAGPLNPTTVTRAADVHTVPTTGWPTTAGEVSVVYTPLTTAAPAVGNVFVDSRTTVTSQGILLYRDASNRAVFNTFAANTTCTATSAALTWTAGTAKAFEARWTPTTCEVLENGVSVATGVATGSPTSHDTNAEIGCDRVNAAQANGWESALCVGRPGSCP